jgi:hypothetical protein
LGSPASAVQTKPPSQKLAPAPDLPLRERTKVAQALAMRKTLRIAIALFISSGDVYRLRGYCRLLAGLCDLTLAYDEKDLFDHTAHLFFKSVDSDWSVEIPLATCTAKGIVAPIENVSEQL